MTEEKKSKPNLFAVEQAMDRVYDSINPKLLEDLKKHEDGVRAMMRLQARMLAIHVEELVAAGFNRGEALLIATQAASLGKKESPQ